mmetsp:Transcript_71874/g.83536  ORF Transcript_71874/g.83536 Transcript_71874/m.83536 type:complete len:318 (+) Transcript_71874:105-1058(+)
MEFIKQLFSLDSTRRGTKVTASSLFKKSKSKVSKCCNNVSKTSPEQQAERPEAFGLNFCQTASEKFNDSTWGLRYQQDKKTLIFDLDNTLIYASKEIPEAQKYTHITLEKNGEYLVRYVVKRPGLIKFLKKLSQFFNICIFTSAEETYAKKVIEATKISKYIYTVYDRAYCKKISEFSYLKNIWNLGFQKDQTILIDDIPFQMDCQPENGINIKPFEGEECDRELYKLYPFLQKMNGIMDVRPVNKYLDDHLKGDFKVKRAECDYTDGCDLDFEEGCTITGIKSSCCPSSMLNRNSLSLLETSLSSTSTQSQADSEH